jgi:hypothetical protein
MNSAQNSYVYSHKPQTEMCIVKAEKKKKKRKQKKKERRRRRRKRAY